MCTHQFVFQCTPYVICMYCSLYVCCTTQGYDVFILLSLLPVERYSPFATNFQPTTIDPTTGPTQPTTIDPNVSADQVEKVLRTAGYLELRSLISYNDYVQDELYMNRSLISREVNAVVKSKPTKFEETKYLLEHVLGNFNLDWLKELAAVLEKDPGNRQNREAGRMLMAAIGKTMDPPTTEHCQGTFVWVCTLFET